MGRGQWKLTRAPGTESHRGAGEVARYQKLLHVGVNALQNSDGDSGGPACSTARPFADYIAPSNQGADAFLLGGRRLFETLGIDAAEEVVGEAESIERIQRFSTVAQNVSVVEGSVKSFRCRLSTGFHIERRPSERKSCCWFTM